MSLSKRFHSIRQAGFTLIEVMIALLIGLIGIVVMMQTFSVSEGFKRTATSGTDAQINGGVALYMLEREVRNSGYGMNALMQMGCPYIRVWNSGAGTGVNMQFFPIMINPAGVPAGDANTDVLLISYGSADSFVAGVPAEQGAAGTATSPFTIQSNWDAFKNGDLFVSVAPGAGAGGSASCVMHEATYSAPASGNCGVPPPGGVNVLTHNMTNYKNPRNACANTAPTHNSSTGIKDSSNVVVPVVHQSSGGVIFNMGVPAIKVYAIRGGNLTMCDWMATDCTVAGNFNVLVNDIVSLRAVYGIDLTAPINGFPGAGTVAPSRVDITTNVYYPSRILSATLEIVARSNLKEKPAVGTVCDATPVKSRPDRAQDWMYQTAAPAAPIDLSTVSADWSCYRYKLFQTSVPLRNMIWRP